MSLQNLIEAVNGLTHAVNLLEQRMNTFAENANNMITKDNLETLKRDLSKEIKEAIEDIRYKVVGDNENENEIQNERKKRKIEKEPLSKDELRFRGEFLKKLQDLIISEAKKRLNDDGEQEIQEEINKKEEEINAQLFSRNENIVQENKEFRERVFLQAKQFASANVTIRNEDQHIKEILKNKGDTQTKNEKNGREAVAKTSRHSSRKKNKLESRKEEKKKQNLNFGELESCFTTQYMSSDDTDGEGLHTKNFLDRSDLLGTIFIKLDQEIDKNKTSNQKRMEKTRKRGKHEDEDKRKTLPERAPDMAKREKEVEVTYDEMKKRLSQQVNPATQNFLNLLWFFFFVFQNFFFFFVMSQI